MCAAHSDTPNGVSHTSSSPTSAKLDSLQTKDAFKPQVRFDNTPPRQMDSEIFYDGLTQMSPLLLKQAIHEPWGPGLKTELEVSNDVALAYGGVFLNMRIP